MEGIGEILRETRERKNVSLDQIEETTKIKKRYLQAMEHEEWSQMPGKVYAKGFLRTYARYLSLDEQSICDLFEISQSKRETEKAETNASRADIIRKPPNRRKPLEVDLHNKPKKNMVYVLCALSVAVLVFAVWAYKTYYLNEIESEKTPPPPIILPVPTPEPAPAVAEPVPEPVILTSFIVKLVATDNCWISLKDHGTLVYEDIMRTGDMKEFSEIEKVEIRIGNAGGLVITLNGLELPFLGRSGQVVTKNYSVIDGIMIDDETGEALS
jgi:transcriptional regulator with XRE-family HTH domain